LLNQPFPHAIFCFPSVSYQWYRGTNSLPGQTNASLVLAGLQLADADVYSVLASNALGVSTSSAVTLTVQAISVSLPVQNLKVGPGSKLVIVATYGGEQPASFQWFKDGMVVSSATNSTLSASNASLFDAGQYVLVANNAFGSITSSVVSTTMSSLF
jgi:hypothetical protein